MESGLNSISRLFNSISELFLALFGFLPQWCQIFIGSALVFSIAVFVYKLIRG